MTINNLNNNIKERRFMQIIYLFFTLLIIFDSITSIVKFYTLVNTTFFEKTHFLIIFPALL